MLRRLVSYAVRGLGFELAYQLSFLCIDAENGLIGPARAKTTPARKRSILLRLNRTEALTQWC
jgi:hypothetical protein